MMRFILSLAVLAAWGGGIGIAGDALYLLWAPGHQPTAWRLLGTFVVALFAGLALGELVAEAAADELRKAAWRREEEWRKRERSLEAARALTWEQLEAKRARATDAHR